MARSQPTNKTNCSVPLKFQRSASASGQPAPSNHGSGAIQHSKGQALSKAAYISPHRQPSDKRERSEKIKKDTEDFLAAGGKVYRADPCEHDDGRISQWHYFTLPGSPRERPKCKQKNEKKRAAAQTV